MRFKIAALVLTASALTTAGAQESPWSFALAAGPTMTSPIVDQDVVYPPSDPVGYSVQQRRRVSVDDGAMVTGRISYRTSETWTMVAELGRGSTSYLYRLSTLVLVGGVFNQFEQRGSASRSIFSVGMTRRSPLTRVPIDLEPQLSLGIQHLAVGNPSAPCLPTGTTVGTVCARFERTWTIPNVGAGLAAVYHLGPRVDAELRAQYALGIASTKDAFDINPVPQYKVVDAPAWQPVRTAYLSLGLHVAP